MAAGAVVGLTGATGYIGGLVLERLLASPDVAEVRSLARRPLVQAARVAQAGPPVSRDGPTSRLLHTLGDLRDATAVRGALEGCDVVFHLAAQVWQGRGPRAPELMHEVNVQGTRNVVAVGAPVVLASSVSVYGAWPDNPLPLHEDHPARPNRECPYAAHKLASEQVCAAGREPWVAVRLAAVLGPRADQGVARAVLGYRVAVPAVSRAPQAVQWMDEADAADILLTAGKDLLGPGRAARQVVNAGTSDWLSAPDAAALARSRVVKAPRALWVAAGELSRRLRLSPFGADRACLVDGPLAVSVERADDLLGWGPTRSSVQVFGDALRRDATSSPRLRPRP